MEALAEGRYCIAIRVALRGFLARPVVGAMR
jgi:hypothetical protein